MCTSCKGSIQSTVDEMMDTPEGLTAMHAIKRRIDKEVPDRLLDLSIGSGRTYYDAYAFVKLQEWIRAGHVLHRPVCFLCDGRVVFHEPYHDKQKDLNNEILRSVQPPFRASFIGGQATIGDGILRWSKPINMTLGEANDWGDKPSVRIPSGGVDLEVGSDSNYCVLHHLTFGSGVARWPYEFGFIVLYVQNPDNPLHV